MEESNISPAVRAATAWLLKLRKIRAEKIKIIFTEAANEDHQTVTIEVTVQYRV